MLPSGQHRYTIPGIYLDQSKDPSHLALDSYKRMVPHCTDLIVDPGNRTMTIAADSMIPELQPVIDQLARSGGIVPYWGELTEREKRSLKYQPQLYSLVYETRVPRPRNPFVYSVEPAGDNKLGLTVSSRIITDHTTKRLNYYLFFSNRKFFLEANGEERTVKWEPRTHDRTRSQPLRYTTDETGVLRFNRLTAFCMCHDRFSMRIYDETGHFIWEDLANIYGSYHAVIFDFQNDGVDEIVVFREEHGNASLLVFRPIPAGAFCSDPRATSTRHAKELSCFDKAVRITLGREIWSERKPIARKEMVIEDPKVIAQIVGEIALVPRTPFNCDYIEWMKLETEYAVFKVEFCEKYMDIVRNGKVSRYLMPQRLFRAIRAYYSSAGVQIDDDTFELSGENFSLHLCTEGPRASHRVSYGALFNVQLLRKNTGDEEIWAFPKYTFYAERGGKAVILRTLETGFGERVRPHCPSGGMSVTLPRPPSHGTWRMFAVQGHSDKVYDRYLRTGNREPLLGMPWPSRKRRGLPKVCVEDVFSNEIEVHFGELDEGAMKSASRFIEELRKSGQYFDEYAIPREVARRGNK